MPMDPSRAAEREAWRSDMEHDFTVGVWPTANEKRVANAAEYIAYQVGQINRNLARLTVAVERIAASNPKAMQTSESLIPRATSSTRSGRPAMLDPNANSSRMAAWVEWIGAAIVALAVLALAWAFGRWRPGLW
jgi:anti-sigma-K factor RskA